MTSLRLDDGGCAAMTGMRGVRTNHFVIDAASAAKSWKPQMPLLEVRNLIVEFPGRRGTLRALDDVSF
ncbi:MAG TPA: hypothetical protein PK853_13155, partial [Ottowia sp.]|nr:hypothetical protein [Ottowia sp.]